MNSKPQASIRPSRCSRVDLDLHATGRVAMLIGVLWGCTPELDWPDSIAVSPDDTVTAALVEAADARWEAAGVHPDAIRVEALDGVPIGWLPASDSMARVCDLPNA